jgi:hypothetical protein
MRRLLNLQVAVASAVALLLGFGLGLAYKHVRSSPSAAPAAHGHAKIRAGALGLPDAPKCAAPAGTVPASTAIALTTAHDSFDRDCYYAPAGRTFTIRFTNPVFTLADHSPLTYTLMVSPSRRPAMRPVIGYPGSGVGNTAWAVFVSKPVRAPATKVFTVQPLSAGTYDLQLLGAPLNVIATLIVH